MTFEAQAAAICEPAQGTAEPFVPVAANDTRLPSGDIADPAPGWATAHPDRAMLFLFVSPRDGALVDELMAL